MVRRQVFHALESQVNEGLSTLLDFCEGDCARSVLVNRFAKQAVTHTLGRQAPFARFVKADLIGPRGGDLNHVFLQGTQACGLPQQTSGFEVRGLAAGICGTAGLEREFGFEFNAADRSSGRLVGGHAARVTGIDHGDDFVCTRGYFLCGLCQLGVGDGLTIVGQQAFDAPVDCRVPIPGAVSREVDERAPTIACAFTQLPNFFQDVFFGSVLVSHQTDLMARNAHGHGHAFGAFHIVWHTFQRGCASAWTVLTQANDQCRTQSRRLRLRLCGPCREQGQGQQEGGVFFHEIKRIQMGASHGPVKALSPE